jgi:hypothetical protein
LYIYNRVPASDGQKDYRAPVGQKLYLSGIREAAGYDSCTISLTVLYLKALLSIFNLYRPGTGFSVPAKKYEFTCGAFTFIIPY